jgi:hypothetical protein
MVDEEPGLEGIVIVYVAVVIAQCIVIGLEELLDCLPLLVDGIYLRAVQVRPVGFQAEGTGFRAGTDHHGNGTGYEVGKLSVGKLTKVLLPPFVFLLGFQPDVIVFLAGPVYEVCRFTVQELGIQEKMDGRPA